jgi:hypothetical protein
MLIPSLSHILAYAPSFIHQHASIKTKALVKMLRLAFFVFKPRNIFTLHL